MKNYRLIHSLRSKLSVITLTGLLIAGLAGMSGAQENWKDDFDDVCGKVQNASDMSDKEMTDLIAKADKILPLIQKSDDPGKKVFLKRLKNCRGVYEFMLESKKTPEK